MKKLNNGKTNIYVFSTHILFSTLLILCPLFINYNFEISQAKHYGLLIILLTYTAYLNYFLLIPLLLFKKKFITYFILTATVILVNYYLSSYLNIIMNFSINSESIEELKKINLTNNWELNNSKSIIHTLLSTLLITIGMGIRITRRWLKDEKEKIEINKERINAELSYLKSQIDPHFFFNTLNNIYSLAQLKSDKAPQTILKLSELMRYNIYEADKNLVFLKEEVNYIQNFIDLQRIRLAKSVDIDFYVRGIIGEKKIEPLLFLPFIENAFKHGIDYSNNCSIDIEITIEDTEISLLVINSTSNGHKKVSKQSGVGLSNIYKRLDLLYNNRHKLEINENDKRFMVKLILEIYDH